MRLIDADELIEGYKHMGYDPTEHPEESCMEWWCKGFNAAVDHCLYHVIHAPTIEPMRKKGKWRWSEDMMCFICSECESGWKEQPTLMGKPLYEWCSVCGADMRGE